MRKAELVMAIAMAIASAGLMWKSAELPIGWIPREGPGGGAFPFWLSAGMLICCIWIIVRWFRGYFKFHGDAPYMDRETPGHIPDRGGLADCHGRFDLPGRSYGAVPLLLIFYMRYIGRPPLAADGHACDRVSNRNFFLL